MPKSCAARQCCNRYSNRRKQLTFHRFPFSRPELLKEWVLNIGRGDFEPKQHTVICSEHFRPECFSAFGNRKNLKHNAVPTVFAFQGPPQLVRENMDPTGRSGDATSGERKVLPEPASGECGLGRNMDTEAEALQLLPEVGGPEAQDVGGCAFPLLLQFPEARKTQATCEERGVTSTGGHGAPGWTCTLQTVCKSYCVPSSRTLNTISKTSSSKSVCPRPAQLSCGPQMALPDLSGRRTPRSSNLRKGGQGENLRRCPQPGITTGHPWQGQGTLPCDKIHVFSSQQSTGTWATHKCPGSLGPAHPLLQAFSLLGN
ncbi:hypothetical protein CapIbe_013888 [Capra ibex]